MTGDHATKFFFFFISPEYSFEISDWHLKQSTYTNVPVSVHSLKKKKKKKPVLHTKNQFFLQVENMCVRHGGRIETSFIFSFLFFFIIIYVFYFLFFFFFYYYFFFPPSILLSSLIFLITQVKIKIKKKKK